MCAGTSPAHYLFYWTDEQADTETSLELIEEMLATIPQDRLTFDVLTASVGDVRGDGSTTHHAAACNHSMHLLTHALDQRTAVQLRAASSLAAQPTATPQINATPFR